MNHFKPGDKVRAKECAVNSIMEHTGMIIHQTGRRVLWECDECNGLCSDDWADDLELIE